jgi:hypothetical protein
MGVPMEAVFTFFIGDFQPSLGDLLVMGYSECQENLFNFVSVRIGSITRPSRERLQDISKGTLNFPE